MLIGQISDLHIMADRALAYDVGDTSYYLEALEKHLRALNPALDHLVVTGDLADRGELAAYEFIKQTFSSWTIPIWVIPGNHDIRANLVAVLGEYCPAEDRLSPFLCYSVDLGSVCLIMLDGVVEGRHSGGLNPRVAEWLEGTLDRYKNRLSLVFTHHPPFFSYMGEMDILYDNAETLVKIMIKHPETILLCGHLHRAMSVSFAGIKAIVAPPVSLPMVLELSPTGGSSFYLAAPAFVLHHYEQKILNSHFDMAPGTWNYSGPYRFPSAAKVS